MKRLNIAVWLAVWTMVIPWPIAYADTPLKSNGYEVDESFIGGGGLITENSTNYSAGESIGDVGVGTSSSTNFQSSSGYTTTNDPALTFIVTSAAINFGTLTNTTTATATATFSVIDYTSYGYNIYVVGDTPSNGTRNLAPMSQAASSQAGTEQFGINLRSNTIPSSLGADPSGGFGGAASGYNTPNQYRYNNGDVIATSAKSSGETDFTISYIVNASVTTGGGGYSGVQSLICVGTY